MTLLLTLVSPAFTVQASDRRLTRIDGTTAVDEANKAVVLARTASAAFTGLAYLDGRHPTDELIMDSFAGALGRGEAPFTRLQVDAGRWARQIPRSTPNRDRILRTSFVIAGFSVVTGRVVLASESVPRPEPFLSVISNAQDGFAEEWHDTASRRFTLSIGLLGANQYLLHAAGQPVRPDEKSALHRAVASALRRTANPEPIARLLARAIREVARSNSAVGRDVMCVMTRRKDAGTAWPDGRISIGSPMPLREHAVSEANFFRSPVGDEGGGASIFLPDDKFRQVFFLPNYVDQQIQMRGGFMAPTSQSEAVNRRLQDIHHGRLPR